MTYFNSLLSKMRAVRTEYHAEYYAPFVLFSESKPSRTRSIGESLHLFMPTISIHPTPNPDSLKFTAEGALIISSGMLAFNSAAEAADHDLGQALFGLDGVTNVFALPQFLTVTKAPATDWNGLVGDVRRILSDYLSSR